MQCPNSVAVNALSSSLDRLNEAQWHVELMQENYHSAAKFRWALSSFLRSLKEILQIITMETQKHKNLKSWYSEERKKLVLDPIINFLGKQRDIIVHQKALETKSKCRVGFALGTKMKLGMGMPIHPSYDSEEAILNYINSAAQQGDFLGILYTEDDESGEYSAVSREWRLESYPDTEVTILCKHAWEAIGKTIIHLARMLGAEFYEPTLELKSLREVSIQIYNPEWIKNELEKAIANHTDRNT